MVAVPMKLEDKISFSPRERAEIERKLLYLDFVARRPFSLPADDDNIVATFLSVSTLTGRAYSAEILSSVLAGTHVAHPDAHFISAYYLLIDSALQPEAVGGVVDESHIMAIVTALRDTRSEAAHEHRTSSAHTLSTKVSPALSELVEWLLVRPQQDELHRLLVVGIFLYEFMTQHAVDDCCEEVMHILALELLRRCGCRWVMHYAPSRIMVGDRVAYHRAVKSHANGQSTLSQWLVYWVDVLFAAAVNACRGIAPQVPCKSPSYTSPLNERQVRILRFVEQNQPVRLAAITKHLHKESVNTIKKDMLLLREMGYVIAEGVPRAMLYYKS